MINQLLHRQPVPVDRAQHRQTRLQIPVKDWGVSSRLNSLFVAASEFGDACREFPVVFIRAGTAEDGSQQIAPIAVLGLTQEDNLYLDGPKWRARYLPALLRIYPFCIARLDDERFAICIDGAWNGVSTTE
ncbi:MAG: SapC family protein, partial [Rubrivivax sp.]|nr:SapC family protein [Rubrivivax sp.]